MKTTYFLAAHEVLHLLRSLRVTLTQSDCLLRQAYFCVAFS
jgi:hypothetical protein